MRLKSTPAPRQINSSYDDKTFLNCMLKTIKITTFCCLLGSLLQAQDMNVLKTLKWRSIGPFRGGRVAAVTGVESRPNTFYFGGVGGGVWKTENAGANWQPVTDGQNFGTS